MCIHIGMHVDIFLPFALFLFFCWLLAGCDRFASPRFGKFAMNRKLHKITKTAIFPGMREGNVARFQ